MKTENKKLVAELAGPMLVIVGSLGVIASPYVTIKTYEKLGRGVTTFDESRRKDAYDAGALTGSLISIGGLIGIIGCLALSTYYSRRKNDEKKNEK